MQKAKENKTIQWVVDSGLCTGCGTCAAICTNSAISMCKSPKGIYIPKLKQEKCSQCGLCSDVCPGHSVDFNELNSMIFGEIPNDVYLGSYINCYIGHATNEKIRYDASSGGLVTALLIFALEEGIIDGALVTRMEEGNPLEPESFIARTKEEILSASKSKYCPVTANIALKQILHEDGKYAVVGLPCHIHGIRKAEMVSKKLRERIILHFGIFCGHTPNFKATDFVLWRNGIRRGDIVKMDYRGNGWFGGMSIVLKDGRSKFIPYFDYWDNGFGLYFFPRRCSLCKDGTCELSDISFGDAWLSELKNDKIGKSIFVTRSGIGESIVQSAKSKGIIEAVECASDKVIQSQANMLDFKKRKIISRFSVSNYFGKSVPVYNSISKPLKLGIIDYLSSLLFYFSVFVASKEHMWCLLSFYISLKRNLLGYASYCKNKIRNLFRIVNIIGGEKS